METKKCKFVEGNRSARWANMQYNETWDKQEKEEIRCIAYDHTTVGSVKAM